MRPGPWFARVEQVTGKLIADGQLPPTCYFVRDQEVRHVVLFVEGFETPALKDLAAEKIRELAAEFGADVICLVVEAWMVTRKHGRLPTGSLEHELDRHECVVFNVDRREGPMLGTAEIERVGDRALLHAVEWIDGHSYSGRFTGLLPTTERGTT